MNESRSTRYHRARRRASAATVVLCAAALAALMASGASAALRDAARGIVPAYAGVLGLLLILLTFPLAWYRSCRVERQYGLAPPSSHAAWLRDYLKAALLALGAAVILSSALYAVMAAFPRTWWLVAAAGSAAALAAVTALAPLVLVPRLFSVRPLGRAALQERITALARRAGIVAPAVHEWQPGGRRARARAMLVGAGATRRILLSDRLLADYSDDEIEMVLAHELGHHVHRDVRTAVAAEAAVLAASFLGSAIVLANWWRACGLTSPADVAGAPILLLVCGTVVLGTRPLVNALSRRNERRADAYALALAPWPQAFISAMRRMAADNLADEAPSRAAFWMCHTHPLVEERIALARKKVG